MTREDAIKILKEYAPRVKPFYEPFRTEYPQAIEMAIESLSAEASAETHGVCSDIISREEVLRVIITAGEVEPDLVYTHLHDVIKSLPSVEPKTGELVRCKDCDWWEKSDNSSQGRCERYGFYPTGEYYCAGAEPKGDGE